MASASFVCSAGNSFQPQIQIGLRTGGLPSLLLTRFPTLTRRKSQVVVKATARVDKFSKNDIIVSPSILSANFAKLGEQVKAVEEAGCDWIHVDVMDGRFVPNITIGPLVVDALRPVTDLPLDVHLMIVKPEQRVPDFVKAGADIVSVHCEQSSTIHLHRSINQIKSLGAKAGVVLNPGTPLSAIEYVLDDICYDAATKIHCLSCPHKPQGSMFVVVKLDVYLLENIVDDMDFCSKLAREESVVVLPGCALGMQGWLRITFAADTALLVDGFERMQSFCLRHTKKK